MSQKRPARTGGFDPQTKSSKMKRGAGLCPSKRTRIKERNDRIDALGPLPKKNGWKVPQNT